MSETAANPGNLAALLSHQERRPLIMGVLNVTPDSFSDGGAFSDGDQELDVDAAIAHGRRLIAEGADILDIGGESTRPGALPVPPPEEQARILPVVRGLRAAGATLSIDTRNAATMRAAAAEGATMWNDVSALTHGMDSLARAAELQCPVVLMHAQGDPQTMQTNPHYQDVVTEVRDFLCARADAALAAGVAHEHIVLDPGIGFGKSLEHNLALLRQLGRLRDLGFPVLLGVSRKSFIARLDRPVSPAERLGGSIAAMLAGIAQGVHIVRVHDVAQTRQSLAVWRAITGG